MNVEEQFQIEHLYLTDRTCRVCGETKNLIDGFYRTRKNKYQPSSYSYECKQCAKKRITKSRKDRNNRLGWEYPDW
jgi:hypothetical protein|tara:strand:- start:84 stop:311 length:228 start_codon:yes stop_codon:yes gene_type:complete